MDKQSSIGTPTTRSSAAEPFVPVVYERGALSTLLIWYVIGVVLMFSGDAIRDTLGLVVVLAETVFLFIKDRRGLISLNGAVAWEQLTKGKRIGLGIVEVLFFAFAVGIYLVRTVLFNRDTLLPPPPQ